MKKLIAVMIAMLLALSAFAAAEDLTEKTADELIAMIEQLQAEVAELKAQLGQDGEEAEPAEAEETPEEPADTGYAELARGAKGEDVVKMQQALKDLGYLSGSADGDFGGGTERAVSSFQGQNGLAVTGVADNETLTLLYSGNAQRAIVYEELDYKGDSRNPSDYEGRYVRFSGKVLQVIESGSTVAFRVATKGSYDDVVYVIMEVPENYSRILEDDRVNVEGTYGPLYSYQTVRGDTLTIPRVNATLVTLR